jgi:hypothetical protein
LQTKQCHTYLSASTHNAKRRKDHGTACVCRSRVKARRSNGHRWVRWASESDGRRREAEDEDDDGDDDDDDEAECSDKVEDGDAVALVACAASAPGTGQLKM